MQSEVHPNTINYCLDDVEMDAKSQNQGKTIKNQRRIPNYLKQVKSRLEKDGVWLDRDIGEHVSVVLGGFKLNANKPLFRQQQHKYATEGCSRDEVGPSCDKVCPVPVD